MVQSWRAVVVATAVALSVASAGCSEGGSGGVNVGGPTGCGQVQPCGGDPIGTWALTSGCVTATALHDIATDAECPGFSSDIDVFDVEGTLTFNADGTYAIDGFSSRVSMTYDIPVACTYGGSCESQAGAIDSNGVLESVTCSGTNLCHCSATASVTDSRTGLFAVSGTNLLLNGDSVLGSGGSFCVDETGLHLITLSDDGSAINSDLVAVAQ